MGVIIEVELVTEICCSCGMAFAFPKNLQDKFRQKHDRFYCPLGHGQYYSGETEAERLRKLFLEEQAENTSLKDELTALKKRVDAGMCPHCHRHFANVSRHLKTKHGIGAGWGEEPKG